MTVPPEDQVPWTAGGVVDATPYIRVAEIDVEPAEREAFIAAVRSEMDESVRVEPGVLALFAVAEKDAPSRLRFFEIYSNESAYIQHVGSRHFQEYRTITERMVRSKVLTETIVVRLSTKALG